MITVKKFWCIVAFLSPLAGVLSGCGSKAGEVAVTTTSTTSVPADQAKVDNLQIRSAAYPPDGVKPRTGSSAANLAIGFYDQLGSCLGTPNASAERTATSSGAVFAQSNNAIATGASAFKTEAIVNSQIKALNDAASYDCILNLLDRRCQRFSGSIERRRSTRIEHHSN